LLNELIKNINLSLNVFMSLNLSPQPSRQNFKMYEGTYTLKTLTKAKYIFTAPKPIQVKEASKK